MTKAKTVKTEPVPPMINFEEMVYTLIKRRLLDFSADEGDVTDIYDISEVIADIFSSTFSDKEQKNLVKWFMARQNIEQSKEKLERVKLLESVKKKLTKEEWVALKLK